MASQGVNRIRIIANNALSGAAGLSAQGLKKIGLPVGTRSVANFLGTRQALGLDGQSWLNLTGREALSRIGREFALTGRTVTEAFQAQWQRSQVLGIVAFPGPVIRTDPEVSQVDLKLKFGIHLLIVSKLIETAQKYRCSIAVGCQGRNDLKLVIDERSSPMDIFMQIEGFAGLQDLMFSLSGPDHEQALKDLIEQLAATGELFLEQESLTREIAGNCVVKTPPTRPGAIVKPSFLDLENDLAAEQTSPDLSEESVDANLNSFRDHLAALVRNLEQKKERIEHSKVGSVEDRRNLSARLEMLPMFMQDPKFIRAVEEALNQGQTLARSVGSGLRQILGSFRSRYQTLPPDQQKFWSERLDDICGAGKALLYLITQDKKYCSLDEAVEEVLGTRTGPFLVAAESLYPLDLFDLIINYPGRCSGLILAKASPTSHVAIIAQVFGLPIIQVDDISQFVEGEIAVVDPESGRVLVNPDLNQRLEALSGRISALKIAFAEQKILEHLAMTFDGQPVQLYLNLTDEGDLGLLGRTRGVGLVRSEISLAATGLTVEDMKKWLEKSARAAAGREFKVRLWDSSWDKPRPYDPPAKSARIKALKEKLDQVGVRLKDREDNPAELIGQLEALALDYQDIIGERTIDLGFLKDPAQRDAEPEELAFRIQSEFARGLFGLDYLLNSREGEQFLRRQLEALLRASADHHNIKIILPMVKDADEVRRFQQVLDDVAASLERENILFNRDIEIGLMVETSEIVSGDNLAGILGLRSSFYRGRLPLIRFLSLGTNDLVQALTYEDRLPAEQSRTGRDLAGLFQPKVIGALKKTADVAAELGLPVTVCGQAAVKYPELFLALGIIGLSVPATALASVVEKVITLDLAETRSALEDLGELDLAAWQQIRLKMREEQMHRLDQILTQELDRAAVQEKDFELVRRENEYFRLERQIRNTVRSISNLALDVTQQRLPLANWGWELARVLAYNLDDPKLPKNSVLQNWRQEEIMAFLQEWFLGKLIPGSRATQYIFHRDQSDDSFWIRTIGGSQKDLANQSRYSLDLSPDQKHATLNVAHYRKDGSVYYVKEAHEVLTDAYSFFVRVATEKYQNGQLIPKYQDIRFRVYDGQPYRQAAGEKGFLAESLFSGKTPNLKGLDPLTDKDEKLIGLSIEDRRVFPESCSFGLARDLASPHYVDPNRPDTGRNVLDELFLVLDPQHGPDEMRIMLLERWAANRGQGYQKLVPDREAEILIRDGVSESDALVKFLRRFFPLEILTRRPESD